MHTPGKLSYDGLGIQVDGQRFATINRNCQIPCEYGWRKLEDEEIDNLSRLIAAAPALLESLEELVAEWDAGNIGRIRKIEGGRMRDDSVGIAWAREAIAAARGEGVQA